MTAFDPLRTLARAVMLPFMHRCRFIISTILACAGTFIVSFPAGACDYDVPLFQLPEETETEARERSQTILSERFVIQHAAREAYDIKNAATSYIGRVVANNRAQGIDVRPSSTVEPIEAIVGSLPSGHRTLTETLGHSCSNYGDGYGDGEGTVAKVGSVVVVFEGLPKSNERPHGIDSLRATSIRDAVLLDRLRKHGKDLDVE